MGLIFERDLDHRKQRQQIRDQVALAETFRPLLKH
jgi:hypothetical protein